MAVSKHRTKMTSASPVLMSHWLDGFPVFEFSQTMSLAFAGLHPNADDVWGVAGPRKTAGRAAIIITNAVGNGRRPEGNLRSLPRGLSAGAIIRSREIENPSEIPFMRPPTLGPRAPGASINLQSAKIWFAYFQSRFRKRRRHSTRSPNAGTPIVKTPSIV